MFNVTPKVEKKLIVKASYKVALGHNQAGNCGRCGVHSDKRLRRQGTRNAQLRKALVD
jgi:hypothetical protein